MTRCEEFIKYFETITADQQIPETVLEFYELLKASKDVYVEQPMFTENGLKILEFLQNAENRGYKSKEIAEGMCISSRSVSGAIRKLVNNGYIEKFGQSPCIYAITQKGKEFNINIYKENN